MPKRQAITGPDFSATERQNVRVLADGTVELAGANLLVNPALLDVDAEGNPVGWGTLVGPPAPTGWHVYDGRSRQNPAPLAMSTATYYQSTSVRGGAPYPQNALTKDAQSPASPTVAAEDNAILGYSVADGWYGFALAWQVGETYTAPSTRATLQMLDGDRVDFTDLPTVAPAGATGLALLGTDSQSLQSTALSATLYIRGVIPLSASVTSYTLSGPPTGASAPANETGVGGFEAYGPLEWRIRPSIFNLEAGSYPLTWRFLTSSGWSAVQESVTVEVPTNMQGRIEVRPAEKPVRATAWEPIYQVGGVWQAPSTAETNFRAYLPILGTNSQDRTLSVSDDTALDAPDAPDVSVSAVAFPDLTGNHKIRVTLDYGTYLESAPSSQSSVTLTTGQTYSVARPTETGGHITVLYDPVDRHTDLTGIAHNQIQYIGPPGTTQDYRITNGAPTAVISEGAIYVLSAHIKAEDISPASMYEVIFRDLNGVALTSADALVELTAGDHAWARYQKAYTAPAGAVFMEVFGHKVGEGTITLAPPQLEEGAVATAFDPDPATSGYVIKAFATGTGAAVRVGPPPTEFTGGGAVATPDPAFTYTLSYASSDTAPSVDPASGWTYFTDIGDVVFRDYVAIKAEIEAV